ncbi:hypothetical protein ACJX0J_007564, partial [Zea mays]
CLGSTTAGLGPLEAMCYFLPDLVVWQISFEGHSLYAIQPLLSNLERKHLNSFTFLFTTLNLGIVYHNCTFLFFFYILNFLAYHYTMNKLHFLYIWNCTITSPASLSSKHDITVTFCRVDYPCLFFMGIFFPDKTSKRMMIPQRSLPMF